MGLEVIRSQRKAYALPDHESVLAPAKRLTGGFSGAFYFSLLFVPSGRSKLEALLSAASTNEGLLAGAAMRPLGQCLHTEPLWSGASRSGAAVCAL